jgi:Mrp family chromosome partitioning ATPase
VADFMFKDEKSNLYIMPKGQAEYANPVDIFSSHRMEALLQAMKDQFDLIIFDSPPVMVVSDARVLAKLVDKTVYVVAWDKTPRKFIKAGLEQLRRSEQISVAGIVLQQVNLKLYSNYSNSGYYYYGKYGQYYVN